MAINKSRRKRNYSVRVYGEDGTATEIPQFHYRGIKVKYYPPTNHKGSRVKLYDTRHKNSVWLSYSYKYSDLKSQAIVHLLSREIEPAGFTYDEKSGEYTILTTNFINTI
mgnify:CR=1 FL=1|tara:strand:+ start:9702 stop:10031 length:330 start_codon:yes stop_codon:yes gene_type:complete